MSKNDIKFIIVFTITSIFVITELILQKLPSTVILLYAGLSILAPICSYFAYGFARKGNKIENYFTEETPGDGTPTKLYVGFNKFRVWLTYCLYTTIVLAVSTII